jgi:MFS family permease
VYQSGLKSDLRRHNADPTFRGRIRNIHRNVWLLGITSLLTDMSSEMVVAVLPVYALYFLHVTPATFGIIDGIQQGGASLVKLLAGFATDGTRRYKTIAASGYGASLLSRLGLLLAGPSAAWLTPLVALDRIGKGMRTAPRDAIISLSVARAELGTAFGVHRTLDTIGALLGPLLGFAILLQIRDGYDVVFVISVALAAIAVAVLVTFVRSPDTASPAVPGEALDMPRDARFARIAVSAALLGLATVSDSFVYLSIQRMLGFPIEYLPLLYVATPGVYLTLATPAGRIADRFGSARVVIAGYCSMLVLYLVLGSGLNPMVIGVSAVILLGIFYAATDGVFAALASAAVPVERRAAGLAAVSTANDVGRMCASVIFGWLWSSGATADALRHFQIGLVVALCVVAVLLWPMLQTEPRREPS